MSRHKRIKKSEDIQRLFESGQKYGSRSFFVSFFNDQETAVAFVAGKKVGIAVKRTRCKRLLREAYRMTIPTNIGIKMVLVARPPLLQISFQDLCREMTRLKHYLASSVS